MKSASRRTLLPFLRLLVGNPADLATDQVLLQRFIRTQDAGAFEVLVARHGPLVRGVCLRALENAEDAEDAFQATFLVLVRNARSIRRLTSVGPWLYGVAQRIACKMRARAVRRRESEKQAAAVRPSQRVDDMTLGELKAILDEEIARLPSYYRAPVILCCAQGMSRDEAAVELGWSVGAVKGRLERGRELLRVRLARRGVTLSAAFLTLTLLESASAVPAALVAATVTAAARVASGQVVTGVVSAQTLSLVQEFARGLLLGKLKLAAVAAVLALGLGGGSLGLAVHQGWTAAAEDEGRAPVPAAVADQRRAAEPLTPTARDTPQTSHRARVSSKVVAPEDQKTADNTLAERPVRGKAAGAGFSIRIGRPGGTRLVINGNSAPAQKGITIGNR
jgi:RNA polymerase sigma factor (sigma-70 family)